MEEQVSSCDVQMSPVAADVILHTPFESLAASAAAAEEAGLDAPEPAAAEPMSIDAEQHSEANGDAI